MDPPGAGDLARAAVWRSAAGAPTECARTVFTVLAATGSLPRRTRRATAARASTRSPTSPCAAVRPLQLRDHVADPGRGGRPAVRHSRRDAAGARRLTAAAVMQMFVARRLAAGHHGSLLPQRTRGIEEFLTEHGAVAVMESRIVPVLPFGIVNFSAGLTRLPYRDLALGTRGGRRARRCSPTSPSAAAFPISARPRRSSRSPARLFGVLGGVSSSVASPSAAPNLPRASYSRPSGSTRSWRSASSAR